MSRLTGDLAENEVTDRSVYLRRREFLESAGTALLLGTGMSGCTEGGFVQQAGDGTLTNWTDVTSYNNFQELGASKTEPSWNADSLMTTPWTVTIDGACGKPGRITLEDFLAGHAIEERIYRLRCVEGWSAVIPWLGFPLADVLRRFEPTASARFVRFETLFDPEQMPGQRDGILQWPYVEGLRMDEAAHPLTIIATGMYGAELPNQNGAPLRLVVPWKYGFKSIKSVVRISFVTEQPVSTWERFSPMEYGFYANVNPDVSHPRWSQQTERRLGSFRKRRTELYNGYGEQVAGLYTGMNLREHF